MEYTKGHLVYFSPTSSSKQVATSIVHGAGIENVSELDLTRHSPGAVQIPSDSLTVIAVPVYGGRVAPLAMQRMKDITGDNTPVVLIAVYGNRAYEKALAELDAYAIGHGFKVIAAATFIGEHSFSTAQNPISKDRPNQDDLTLAREFGNKIIAKITAAADMEHLYSVDVTRIQRPKQPLFPLLGFLRQMIKLRKSGVPMPKTPATDPDTCIHCGECVELCPNNAIVAGDELNTIADRCIRCCACVKGCPQDARTLNSPMAPLLSKYFARQKANTLLV